MNRHVATKLLATLVLVGASVLSSGVRADENRRGLQLEGMIGVAACLPGRAPCRHDDALLSGRTKPSFATGAAIGIRPFRWFMVGALYRWGMFNPDYRTDDGADYRWGGQHTVALMVRPILPIWRFDLGLNLAPGWARQVFRRDAGSDRDYSQGFAMLVGPTVDVYVTERFFLGAEADFIFNTQSKTCRRRGGETVCEKVSTSQLPPLTPTHQMLFGLHLGVTLL